MNKVLFLLVVVAFVAIGEALKCYDCRWNNTKCAEFDSKASGVVEKVCNDQAIPTCYTFTIDLKNGTIMKERSCGLPGDFSFSRSSVPTTRAQGKYHVNMCESDLCNGVSSNVVSLTTLAVLVVPLMLTSWH